MDKISVIIPVYNEKIEYLEKCLNSVASQSYDNLEVIIVDDGSKKEVADFCDSYSNNNKFKVFHNENKGVSSTRNFGIEKANGKWISFLDSDDWLEPDAIENLYKHADKSNWVISRYYSNDIKKEENDSFDKIYDCNVLFNAMFYQNRFLSCILESCWAKLYSKQIIIDNNLSFKSNIKRGEDMLFNLEYMSLVKQGYISSDYTYHYRVNLNSATRKYRDDYLEVNYNLLSRSYNIFEERYADKINCFYFMSIRFLNRACEDYIFSKNNSSSYIEKVRLLRTTILDPLYSDAIKNVDLSNLGRKRKLLVVLLRLHLYYIICFMYTLRKN